MNRMPKPQSFIKWKLKQTETDKVHLTAIYCTVVGPKWAWKQVKLILIKITSILLVWKSNKAIYNQIYHIIGCHIGILCRKFIQTKMKFIIF